MITETGCYIDGSHRSSFDFSVLVIEMAHHYGFDMDFDQFVKDVQNMNDDNYAMDIEEEEDIIDTLDWTYYQALDYLNEITREGLYWEVIDQSLYLTEVEDAEK